MSPVPLLATCGMDGDAMSCKCSETLQQVAWLSNYVLCNELHISQATALESIRDGVRDVLAIACSCVTDFIDQHSVTCDCCDHVMIDVTAARAGGEQHSVAGDPEGDGMGCAHSWRETVVTLEAEGDQLRAKVEELEATLRSRGRLIMLMRLLIYANKGLAVKPT